MATQSKLFLNTLAVFLGLALFCANPVHAAFVETSSEITLTNLQISFANTDPDADPLLLWTDTWYGTVQAFAQQTGDVPSGDFNDLLADDGSIPATALSGQVESQADYLVSSANPILGMAQSSLTLNAPNQQGDAGAITTFDNFFTLVNQNDESDTSAIDVIITLDYVGFLTGAADPLGYFSAALSTLLTLESIDANGVFAELDTASFNASIPGGNSQSPPPYQGTLTIPFRLNYNSDYWLYAEADSEVYGATAPEPTTLMLVLTGLGFIGGRRLKKAGRI